MPSAKYSAYSNNSNDNNIIIIVVAIISFGLASEYRKSWSRRPII